ncbi:HNH endonuclease [Granulicatella sp. 19428wC4_WM01]|nr:HNH endonuclease [Granulicatella sp. 19428wC4_WM01]TFU95383.1 HNH endonuclease [Granulicatella sp. WM01]
MDGKNIAGRLELANKVHPVTGVPFDSDGFPIFEVLGEMNLQPEDYLKSRATHFDRASKDLYNQILNNSDLASQFTSTEIEIFKNGGIPKRFTWHHHQNEGLMQLVDRKIHRKTGHIGGYSIWGKGN